MTSNSYCVILAGGMGRRLWPCSRETHPKQFVDFFGVGRTQLQQTYDRFLKILPPENILVSTSEEYVHFVREQLPELQSAILESASQCLKSGGVLVYSTCTLERAENEDVVERFLSTHDEFQLAESKTLLPDIDGTDGFFYAKLTKTNGGAIIA